MRIIIDSLIALMLVAVVAGLVMLKNDRQQGERDAAVVRGALDRLHEQAAYHTAVQSAMAGQDTLLVHLHESWFGDYLPTNALLGAGHPWLDLAPPGDLGMHPPDPVATDKDQAEFWYNPTTGVFRARVSPQTSEAQTLALYNEVNGTSLDAFEQIPDPSRHPIAHELGKTPATRYASMANRTWSEPEPDAAELNDKVFAPLMKPRQEQPVVLPAVPLPEPVDGVYEAGPAATTADHTEPVPDANEPADETAPPADRPRPKLR